MRTIPKKMITETFDSCLRASLVDNLPEAVQKQLVSCTITDIENKITTKTGRKCRFSDAEKNQIRKVLRNMED